MHFELGCFELEVLGLQMVRIAPWLFEVILGRNLLNPSLIICASRVPGCSYATYVDALEACSRDNLEYVKDRAVKALFELLSAKPEQASDAGMLLLTACSASRINCCCAAGAVKARFELLSPKPEHARDAKGCWL